MKSARKRENLENLAMLFYLLVKKIVRVCFYFKKQFKNKS